MNTKKLSVVLATYNEESNLGDCLKSIKDISDEIIIVDGSSTDKTVEIAKEYGAKVTITNNPPIFHINKQKALVQAKNTWILQLDADERITPALSKEIMKVIEMNDEQIAEYQKKLPDRDLFLRHQKLIEQRDGHVGNDSAEYGAFFIPRLNYFLGKYLRFGGVYPDPAIRLVKKGKAHFPCKDVHELIAVDGKVGWLNNPMHHVDSPTFSRYIARNNRYINVIAMQMKEEKLSKNIIQFINYVIIKPLYWFLLTTFRHKGILDGYQGVIFSFFSALRFPRAYLKYLFGGKR